MAPLEHIIWEAKLKSGTSRDIRRVSTTVDESGCIVTRGFLVPSRSSSIDSLARSSISSLETVGTPASPVDEAPPGFPKPTAALYNAPELQALKDRLPAALCRPSKSDGNLTTYARRPALGDRRRTWQVDRVASSTSDLRRGSSSRWEDDELADVTCQPTPPDGLRTQSGVLEQAHAHLAATKQNKCHVKRMKSAQLKLNQLQFPNVKSKRRPKAPTLAADDKKAKAKQGPGAEKTSTTDTAIASDSEDDFSSDDDDHASNGRPPRPNYANYAERRARADDKVIQLAGPTPVHYQTSALPNMLVGSSSENAIESDDEDDDIAACKSDGKINARLSLAQVHCTQNALATKIDPVQLPKRRKSPLSVSIAPAALTELNTAEQSTDRGNAAAEVNTFEPDDFVANRALRPSRTQPRPAKGVLKNTQTAETQDIKG